MTPNRKALVGLFLLGGVLLFSIGLFWIGDRRLLFSENIELAAEFANLSNLKVGSTVLVSGMGAGEVLQITVPSRPGEKFRVRFRVLDKFRPILRTDSVATIQVEGLVGSKILQVEAGTNQAPPVQPGGLIQSREPLEIADVVQRAVDTIGTLNSAVVEVQGRVVTAVDTFNDVGQQAKDVTVRLADDAEAMLTSGRKIAADVETVVDDVRAGRGTVGKLFTDDKMYEQARTAVDHLEAVAQDARDTSADVKDIVADLKTRDIGAKVEATAANLQQATSQVKDVMASLRPSGDGAAGPGLLEEVRSTLGNTQEATADLAENMEALKRNWFFRGFYRNRGFYDLDAVSVKDYMAGAFAPNRARERSWLHINELFTKTSDGGEALSEAGKKRLAEVVAPYLRLAANTPMMVEGYAGVGSADEAVLRSRERARAVRSYLLERYDLRPNYVGTMPMGAVRSEAGQFWDGVAVVYFPEASR